MYIVVLATQFILAILQPHHADIVNCMNLRLGREFLQICSFRVFFRSQFCWLADSSPKSRIFLGFKEDGVRRSNKGLDLSLFCRGCTIFVNTTRVKILKSKAFWKPKRISVCYNCFHCMLQLAGRSVPTDCHDESKLTYI